MRRTLILVLLLGCASPETGGDRMRAGTAKVKITPTEPVMLAGYGSRNKPSEGVAADLWARALAIDEGLGPPKVLVTADILGFGPVISRAIKFEAMARYGLSEDRLMLVGSHTHSGPVISERALVDHPEQVRSRDTYVDGLRAKILGVIGEALDGLAPATFGRAMGEGTIGMYRRVAKPDGTWGFGDNPEGKTDPDVPVMAVRSPDGKLRALLFTYACHCTSIRNGKDGFYQVHPDWAICCARLEAKRPGTQVMYVTGCGGDIDPGPKGALSQAEQNGEAMLRSLEAVLETDSFERISGPIQSKMNRLELPLEKLDPKALQKMAASPRLADQKLAESIQRNLQGAPPPAGISYPIQVWKFGRQLTLVALAGETCVEYALRLKKELGRERLWPIGYANEVMCYIPSERILKENGYESGWSLSWGRGVAAFQMAGSGWPTPFAPGLENRIIAAVHQLVKD
jgi:hypothetical protein